jgi:glycosyltransferase involved in cell wall biosynthesis
VQAMTCADAGLSPTQFQRDRHPAWFKDRIRVIHDGIDTDRFKPDPQARFILQNENIELRSGDEIVTFVVRELEPYRGYHIFMRALPELLRRRPQVSVVIVGGDSVSYGAPPPVGSSWKTIFLNEVKAQLDMSRVHFVGKLAHEKLTQLMQVSTVHAYLTYPFVLSWSMMEAMSIGCLIVGSKTAPVEELIEHGKNGLLTDFFNPQALAETIADALDRKEELAYLGRAARQTIIDRYDLQRICLPAQLDFVLNF